ncbi:MAG: hypothetical protein ACW98Y_09570 [Candidatus Thorarchaeota archaeon]
MRKETAILISLCFVFLFIGSDLYLISNKSASITSSIETRKSSTIVPEFQQVLADETPPRTPTDLKELVIELQSVTPLANQSDLDTDGLYDPVELVIGTNVLDNDTDSDQLSDYDEIMLYGTDPLLPDSNDDEFLDYDEVSVALDLDNDGIPNPWDFDNDGDGVNDYPDLSPHAKSEVQESFDITVHTDGEPTYITFQVVPEDPEHLKLVYQSWDWPDDDEGLMQDLDGSKEDITIQPLLNILTDDLPNSSLMNEFGLKATANGYLMPLTPVYEFGNIVAFNGRVLYMDSAPLNIDLQARLQWQVNGASDVPVNVLMLEGNYVSVGQDGYATGNTTDEADASHMEWHSLGGSRYSIRLRNGPYLSVDDDGYLVFNATEVNQREIFVLNDRFRIYNGKDPVVLSNGLIRADDVAQFDFELIELGPIPESTNLVRYNEPFMLSGLSLETSVSSEIGIFGNVTDKNQTFAAQWVMDHLFVNNATTTLSDMPGLIEGQNTNVSYYIQPTRDRYDSLLVANDEIIPLFLEGAPEKTNIPIIIAMEDTSKSIDLSDMLTGSYILQGTCDADITISPEMITKTLKLNWFNSTSFVGLSLVEACAEALSWQMEDNATYNMLAAIIGWHKGVSQITSIGGIGEDFDSVNLADVSKAATIAMIGIESIGFAGQILSAFKNWKSMEWFLTLGREGILTVVNTMKIGTNINTVAEIHNSLGKSSKFVSWLKYGDDITAVKSVRFAKYFKLFDEFLTVVGILVDVAMGIISGWKIADQIGGDVGRTIGALYGVFAVIMALALSLTMYLLVQIPVIGWLLAIGLAIADSVGNYSSKMVEVLVEAFFGRVTSYSYVIPNTNMDATPTVNFHDAESNGLDVGDGIILNGTVWSELDVVIKGAQLYRNYFEDYYDTSLSAALRWITKPSLYPTTESHLNYNVPYIKLIGSDGTEETAGVNYYTGVIDETYRTYQTTEYEDGVYWAWTHHVVANKYPWLTGITTSVAAPNYAVALSVYSEYKVSNLWYHHPVWKFWSAEPVLKRDWGDITWTDEVEVTKLYYDVFPNNLDDFLEWSSITLNDYDGDGINDDDEATYGTSPYDYDSDGDGLNDNYEITQGLDPLLTDSDSDTLSDWYEHVYETNATDVDTDQDGLTDFQEISGWIIGFNYLDNSSLPFQIPVTSDPADNDTDHDGTNDYDEYLFNTNPRSNDTNGDGAPDVPAASVSQAIYEKKISKTFIGEGTVDFRDVAVDDYGDVYASGGLVLFKFNSSLDPAVLPPTSFFSNITPFPTATPGRLRFDNFNDWLYGLHTIYLARYNITGTEENPDSWTPIVSNAIRDFDFDASGNLYTLSSHLLSDWSQIDKYSSDGTLLATWGSEGPGVDQFDRPTAMAIDTKYGFIYVCDVPYDYSKPHRLMKFRLSDGAFLEIVASGYDAIIDVDIDDDGYVYVLGYNESQYSVQKFSPLGVEDIGFKFSGVNFKHLAIGPDKSIYVCNSSLAAPQTTTACIVKYSQIIVPASDIVPGSDSDWDNDTLTNTQEIVGWDITVNYPTGEETFRVTSSPLMNDTDLDGLRDELEFTLGSNPRSMDTDMDGVSDHEEWWLDTYPSIPYLPPSQQGPLKATSMQPMPPYAMILASTGPSLTDWDTDKDSLGDGIELTFGSSPSNPDSDADTLGDALEFVLNSNPNSADTDGDNATDAEEYAGNSSLIVIDSDGDFLLDGAEYDAGSNATNPDHDGDSIPDGDETIYGTSFLTDDTDGDGISDSTEFALWLNPLSNDTDGDGVLDLTELEMGSNPLLGDTDGDGVPDNMDPDTYDVMEGPLVIAYDPSVATTSVHFVGNMSSYINVEVVSVSELLSDYQDAPYVLLIGQPDSGSTTASGVIYNLLEDAGDILDDMMEEDAREIAIRYGIWNENQTVIMMSSVLVEDIYLVLQVLKGREVTILPDSYTMTFSTPPVIYTTEVVYQFEVFGIDPFKATDSLVQISMTSPEVPTLSVTRYNATTTPHTLDSTNGLEDGEYAMGRYLEVDLSESDYILDAATIWIYYRHSDLDINRDGVVDTSNDLNESTLVLYYYNVITDEWIKLSEELDWVNAIGVNTTDVEIYGEAYAGYIWVQVEHLSLFAVAGQVYQTSLYDDWMFLVALAISGVVIVGVVFAARRFRGQGRRSKHSKLIDDLID